MNATEAARESGIERAKAGARQAVRGALGPIVAVLARLGVKPDHVTWLGLLVTIAGGVLFGFGHFRVGTLVALVGCLMDSLDGALARAQNGVTRWGAFLDSTTDRIADAALFLGVGAYYGLQTMAIMKNEDRLTDLMLGPPAATAAVLDHATELEVYCILAALALVGAYLVSYTRARMEGLGVECKVGWFERPERLVVFLFAGLFGAASPVMPWALVVLTVLSFFTAFQRVAYARSRLQSPV
jgi:CDP-diacylglycerol--glycerol-3-phosphate 3-phosphatidyltransferase